MPKRMLLLVALHTVTTSASAQEYGDPEQGRALVTQWCTTCHVVDRSGEGADVGPPLPALLDHDLRTPDEIRGWLADPHPPMPDLDLSRQEIEDVVAYLESLRDQTPQ
ncbi:MAG TPA: cytochrome c [Geminicoccaceae bacterium]